MKLGILGGGQLGLMTVLDARRLGITTIVLDPDPSAPARPYADEFIRGPLDDEVSIRRVVSASDVTTFEIEHIATEVLLRLEAERHVFHPSAAVLATIQDKLAQKQLFDRAGIPVPRFSPVGADWNEWPAIWKARRGGYDGRGVQVVHGPADVPADVPGMLELLIPVATEIAVLIVRGAETDAVFPIMEMAFEAEANICTEVFAPATISRDVTDRATEIGRATVAALGGRGVFAVEMFVTPSGELYVNEVAPRPHNSGHLTIEACETSQFEQHVRAVLGLPLGSPRLICPAAMRNLLGAADGGTGRTRVSGLDDALAVPGARLHLYGKHDCRPFRKMGHVTAVARTVDEARDRAAAAAAATRITGER